MKKRFIFLTALIFPLILEGQSFTLTMDACLEQGRQTGPKAMSLRQSTIQLMADRTADEAAYRPQLSLSGNLPGLNRSTNSVTQPDGSVLFKLQSQMYSSLALNLNQQMTLTGGNVYLSGSSAAWICWVMPTISITRCRPS